MNYHQNAPLTIQSRGEMIRRILAGATLREVAEGFGLSTRSAAKWLQRYRQQRAAGLQDRSSRPHRLRQPTSPENIQLIETLRRERWTGWRIALQTGLSRATVSRILRRLELSRARIWSLGPQWNGMSTRGRAICSTSTSRSLGGFEVLASRDRRPA